MHHCHLCPEGKSPNRERFEGCQDSRFFALLRIEPMLHCLCGPLSIPLSFSTLRSYPQAECLLQGCGTESRTNTPALIVYGVETTRVFNPVCPYAFEPQRASGYRPESCFRHRKFLHIYLRTFHHMEFHSPSAPR